jgi:hypothetical protein
MGIKLKRSAVAGKVPQLTDLELGELAMNTADGKIYLKKSVGGTESIVEVGNVTSVAGKTGIVTLAISDIPSLQGALDGKAAASHAHAIANVTGLQGALDAKAPLASPAFDGTPTAPDLPAYTNTLQIATAALVYKNATRVPINWQNVAAYTLVVEDSGKMVQLEWGTAITLTVPAGVFGPGRRIDITQLGAGQVSVVAGAGMTIYSNGNQLKLAGQYAAATLHFWDANRVQLIGDIVA